MQKNGHIPNLDKALISDSVATIGADMIGTSTATAILESAVGIESRARNRSVRIIFETLLLPDLVYYTDFDVGSGFCNLLRFSYLMLQESVTRINFKEI